MRGQTAGEILTSTSSAAVVLQSGSGGGAVAVSAVFSLAGMREGLEAIGGCVTLFLWAALYVTADIIAYLEDGEEDFVFVAIHFAIGCQIET